MAALSRKWRTIIKVSLLVDATLAIVAVGLYLRFRVNVNHDLPTEIARARRAGLWTQASDFDRHPPVPDAENAGPKITALHNLVQQHHWQTGMLASFDEDAAQETAFLRQVNRIEPDLVKFRAIAQLPKCDFHRNWNLGTGVRFAEFATLKKVFQVTGAKARIMARHDDPLGGLRLLAATAPLAQFNGSDPLIIPMLVEMACDAITLRAVQDILGIRGRDPGVPEAATKVLAALGPPPNFTTAISGETALGLISIPLSTFRANLNDPEVDLGTKAASWLSRDPSFGKLWRINHLKVCEALLVAVKTNPKFADRKAAVERIADNVQNDLSIKGLLENYLFFGDALSAGAEEQDQSRRRVARQLIAALESWNKTGNKPTHLLLGGDDAIDPITDGPIQFKAIPGGFKIWGVARDGTDHGGNLDDGITPSADLDVAMGYPYRLPPVHRLKKTPSQ